MSAVSLDALSARQREWINTMMGREMVRGPSVPHNPSSRRTGRVVDFKLDVAGIGVFFVLDLGADFPGSDRYVERYRKLPRP